MIANDLSRPHAAGVTGGAETVGNTAARAEEGASDNQEPDHRGGDAHQAATGGLVELTDIDFARLLR